MVGYAPRPGTLGQIAATADPPPGTLGGIAKDWVPPSERQLPERSFWDYLFRPTAEEVAHDFQSPQAGIAESLGGFVDRQKTADDASIRVFNQLRAGQEPSQADWEQAITNNPVIAGFGMSPGKIKGEVPPAAAKPTILSRANPTPEDVQSVMSAAQEYGRKGWPTAERGVFQTTPEAYAETTALVPQVSVKSRLPGPLPGEELPNKERAAPIVENTDEIANRIAERLAPMVRAGDERLKFYHTGPVIRGLEQYGEMPVGEANRFMRDWAGQGAATSPRTQTPPNLRNSSYLGYQRASGNPLTPERFEAEGNRPGFPMMGMHVDLADKFAQGAENPWTNPKPFTFRENWSGNLQDVTGDTHNIRATLHEMDQIAPGSLPRGWFKSDAAYAKYREQGYSALDPGDIADTLGDKTVKGVKRQSEYLPMTEPWYRAAERAGVAPAEGQSGGWFSYGGITGLKSPPKTIVNLLNDQIAATAKALNVSPEKVVNWWSRGKIPLAGAAGVGLAGALATDNQAQAADRRFGSLGRIAKGEQ